MDQNKRDMHSLLLRAGTLLQKSKSAVDGPAGQRWLVERRKLIEEIRAAETQFQDEQILRSRQ